MTRFSRELEPLIDDMERKVDEGEVTWARRCLVRLEEGLLVIERHLHQVPIKSRKTEKYKRIVLLKATLEDCYMQLVDPLVGIEAEYAEFLQETLVEHPGIVSMVLREAKNGR